MTKPRSPQEDEFHVEVTSIDNPSNTQVVPMPSSGEGSTSGVTRRNLLWRAVVGSVAAAASGSVVNTLKDDEVAQVRSRLEAQIEAGIQAGVDNRTSVGANNMEVLNILLAAGGTPDVNIWGESRQDHATRVAREIEMDPVMRTDSVGAFRYACQAMQARNYAADPSNGQHALATADLFEALGIAYNPANAATSPAKVDALNALTTTQNYLAYLSSPLATDNQTALENTGIIQVTTLQFARQSNLDPAFISQLSDPGVMLGGDSAETTLIQTVGALNLALVNTAMAIGVPFDIHK